MNLRNLLRSTSVIAALPILLAACSGSSPKPDTQAITAQVIADAQGMVAGINKLVPQLEATTPPLLTVAQGDNILANSATALAELQTVSTSTALLPGATALAKVFGGLDTSVAVLSSLQIPPPYSYAVMAISLVLPEAEAELAKIIGAASPPPVPAPVASMHAKATARGMTVKQARDQLMIPTS